MSVGSLRGIFDGGTRGLGIDEADLAEPLALCWITLDEPTIKSTWCAAPSLIELIDARLAAGS